MKQIILIIFCTISLFAYSQDSVNFNFIVKNPIIFDTSAQIYADMNLEFNYQRIYLAENIFKEKGLFTRNNKKITTSIFKKNKSTWHLKNRVGKWILFYSDSCKKMPEPEMLIGGEKYRVNWLGKEKIYNIEVSAFVLNPIGFTISPQPKYLFNSARGIIAIKIDGLVLIRNDIVE